MTRNAVRSKLRRTIRYTVTTTTTLTISWCCDESFTSADSVVVGEQAQLPAILPQLELEEGDAWTNPIEAEDPTEEGLLSDQPTSIPIPSDAIDSIETPTWEEEP